MVSFGERRGGPCRIASPGSSKRDLALPYRTTKLDLKMTDYKAVRIKDIKRLDELLSPEYRDKLSEKELEAFVDMREKLQQYRTLTEDARKWVYEVYERFVPQYTNLISSGKVPNVSTVELLVKDQPQISPWP